MTFQAYLDAVRAKTGMTPEQLKTAATKAGVYSPGMTATTLLDWLAKEFALGRGHGMSVWAVWKSKGWVAAPAAKKKGATREGGRVRSPAPPPR
ncbi:MAG: DUF4287 domain-containing protein [Gemmatimonadetes bacterium]|nr:DUF4287 domain-containing protein [Gemmatimonadota bacterium]